MTRDQMCTSNIHIYRLGTFISYWTHLGGNDEAIDHKSVTINTIIPQKE